MIMIHANEKNGMITLTPIGPLSEKAKERLRKMDERKQQRLVELREDFRARHEAGEFDGMIEKYKPEIHGTETKD